MVDFIKVFFAKSWEFFSVKWPGADFSIGTAFLAVLVSVTSLTIVMKMAGVSAASGLGGVISTSSRGGNNRYIRPASDERKGDTF